MPSRSEVLGDGSISRQKPLGVTRRFEPLQATLALTRRAMRVLTTVIEIATLAMLFPWENLALGCAIAFELIGDDHARHVLQSFVKFFETLLGRLLVAPALDQDVEHVVVLIDGPPQVMPLATDKQKHFVEMLFISGPRPPAAQLIGIVLAELETPLADGFIGDIDTACKE